MLLARAATRTLDLQYYIWHADLAGTLLFEEVRAAADRGVRVRMLLDDNSTSGLDETLSALDDHPSIEVRLFNPFVIRSPRLVGYLTDFRRLNRRMHNKSFTADNRATIIGGRNVGDEYFGAGDGALFADLDVVAIGPVVQTVSRDFDRYWTSGSSYPAAKILSPVRPDGLARVKAASLRTRNNPVARAYLDAVRLSSLAQDLLAKKLAFEWAPTRMASDDPSKGLGLAPPDALLWPKLTALLGEPQERLGLVSGYFVPTAAGVDAFTDMERRGIDVSILTNAMEATDVPIVHSGYAKWRKRLLRSGVRLYEMRGAVHGQGLERNITAVGSTGSSVRGAGSALHAKTFTVDGARIFIGSFNFDPRSANLNTELGFVIESPSLARHVRATIERLVTTSAYEVRLNEDDEVYWREHRNGKVLIHNVEPGTSRFERAVTTVLSTLPIEWLL
ncbi:phospholipase D family protein [Sphingomonas sp. S1-29]|uniref:phospholipase D family protein n=1 Tax=Sphingomonas sp. S1-29 TaxID=2991074 RepID=UPI002240D496|nr:phospholipase D family protein [Sphingomonas sp. S1-29]UZK68843.1 phospholipase D family protein [Sphingomonas sp. S1-29]